MNFYKLQKLAYRGNIPKMEDPDTIGLDPYKKRRPGDGRGQSLVQMGDEETEGSVGGTRARGTTFPEVGRRDVEGGEYNPERKRDIPGSDLMFIPDDHDKGKAPIGEGANDNRFVSDEDIIRDDFADNNNSNDPVGIHNMQTYESKMKRDPYKDVTKRTRNRIR